jgi:glycosyltransferase involved in cell wall biosynthesis
MIKPAIGKTTMNTPSISVNMCVWRPQKDYFRIAVQSIIQQTVDDFELIIVEDPSDVDGQAMICDLCQDPRVKYIKNPQRTGLVRQRNQALSSSAAPYIAFLDADDFAEPHRFERQLEWFTQNRKLAFLGSWITLMDEVGNLFGIRRYPVTPSVVANSMTFFCALAFPAVMCRRDSLRELRGFQGNSFVTDYDLWCRAVCAGYPCDNIPETLVRYRIHRSARTRKKIKRVLFHTIRTKVKYFRGKMSYLAYLRIVGELVCMLLPSALVDYSFRRLVFEPLSESRLQ